MTTTEQRSDPVTGDDGSDVDAFLAAARAFLDSQARPRGAGGRDDGPPLVFHESEGEEEAREVAAARDWQRAKHAAGFGWITGPREHGGRGLSDVHDRVFRRLEQDYDLPDQSSLRIGVGTVAPAVLAHGTPAQVRDIAAAIMRGDLVACQLFSEPGAGSDLAAVRTLAARTDTGWLVNGQKVWTSNAQFSDVGLLLARTQRDDTVPALTMFVLGMDLPGVDVRPLRQITGGASFNEVFLDDVHLDDDARLGDVGAGWTVARTALGAERGSLGNRYLGVIRRAYEALLRDVFASGRGDDPIVRQELGRVHVLVMTTDLLNRRVARAIETGSSSPAPALDRLMVATALTAIADAACRVLGDEAFAPSHGTHDWRSFYLGAPGMHLGGGTDEIVRTAVAERVLGLPREPRSTTKG